MRNWAQLCENTLQICLKAMETMRNLFAPMPNTNARKISKPVRERNEKLNKIKVSKLSTHF